VGVQKNGAMAVTSIGRIIDQFLIIAPLILGLFIQANELTLTDIAKTLGESRFFPHTQAKA
jgi:hypothetical protein